MTLDAGHFSVCRAASPSEPSGLCQFFLKRQELPNFAFAKMPGHSNLPDPGKPIVLQDYPAVIPTTIR